MAMAAYYLKGVSGPNVLLSQIFRGCMPYMYIIVFCMAMVYMFPGIITWLPDLLYSR